MTRGPWEYISMLLQHTSWIMNLQSSFMDSMDPLIIGGGWKFLFYQPIESKVWSLLWWTTDSTSWMKWTPFKDHWKLKVICRRLTTSKMVGYKTKLWKWVEICFDQSTWSFASLQVVPTYGIDMRESLTPRLLLIWN